MRQERLLAAIGSLARRITAEADDEPRRGSDAGRRVILLVEDDEATNYAVARTLVAAGFDVLTAPDYLEALKVLDSPSQVDLLLTDVRLTAGTPHGFALGRMARMRRPEIKLLYITGMSELPESEVAAALGRILHKPVDPATLLREISSALSES